MNSASSFLVKFNPLQQPGSTKTFWSPVTQRHGLVYKREGKKYPIKCSSQKSPSQGSLYLTNKTRTDEDIINRNHKTLNKSTVPLASQDDNFKIVSTSFVDVLNKKLDALYRLTRPYTWIGIIIGILSTSLLPVQSLADLTPTFFMEVLKSMVPAILMNIFVSAINQLSDVEIDKVNKPHLPLASGDFSIGEGVAIAVISTMTSVAMGIMLGSPPLFIGLITWWIVGAAYSIDLPLLRWKGSPLMAAVTIMILNGLLLQFPYFVHVQKYVLGRPLEFTKPLLFAAAFMGIFNIAIAFVKDLPDVEGDKEFGLRTLPVILGKEKVFSISVSMLLMAYGAAILTGASSPFLLCKLVTMIGHSVLGFILWHQSRTIDLSDAKSMQSLYMFIFKLYYAEFFLIHFIR
ncbi:hypothetical protein AB3S75_016302 [Citrus x aurantiifolia]